MKFRKRIMAAAMTVAMAVAMVGCNGNNGGDNAEKGLDPETLLKTANETMANVESFSADMNMTFDMEMAEEKASTEIVAKMEAMTNPLKLKMDMSTKMNGEEMQAYQMYAMQDGETATSYINVGGQWAKQSISVDDLAQYNAEQNMDLYLNNLSNFSATGSETINGKETTIIEGVLTGDAMKEAMKNSGLESATAGMGMSVDEVVSMIEGDMPVKLWITEDGYVMQYDLNMTQMMQSLMDGMAKGQDLNLKVSNVNIKMTCDNYNAIENIELPAEAQSAA